MQRDAQVNTQVDPQVPKLGRYSGLYSVNGQVNIHMDKMVNEQLDVQIDIKVLVIVVISYSTVCIKCIFCACVRLRGGDGGERSGSHDGGRHAAAQRARAHLWRVSEEPHGAE